MKRKRVNSRKGFLRPFLVTVAVTTLLLAGMFAFIMYGPFHGLRDLWITTAMTTRTHQYLATVLFSDATIAEVLDNNKTIEPDGNTNASEIVVSSDDRVELQYCGRDGFKAYMLIVHDPSRVKVGITDKLLIRGQKVSEIVSDNGYIAGINAGGFEDPEGNGSGGVPTGLVIQDGKVLYSSGSREYSLIGFDKRDRLILGRFTLEEIAEAGIRDAVDFKPLLIVNGEASITKGNGGWGIAPRTAIGQRSDGTVLLLVIDGRQAASVGASLKDVIDIMLEYGAVNAANLDGGSSTTMVYDGETINKPCSKYGPRHVASAFVVTAGEDAGK